MHIHQYSIYLFIFLICKKLSILFQNILMKWSIFFLFVLLVIRYIETQCLSFKYHRVFGLFWVIFIYKKNNKEISVPLFYLNLFTEEIFLKNIRFYDRIHNAIIKEQQCKQCGLRYRKRNVFLHIPYLFYRFMLIQIRLFFCLSYKYWAN